MHLQNIKQATNFNNQPTIICELKSNLFRYRVDHRDRRFEEGLTAQARRRVPSGGERSDHSAENSTQRDVRGDRGPELGETENCGEIVQHAAELHKETRSGN